MDGVDFGVFLVPEDNTYETLRTRALIADKLRYHSLWVSDHLLGMYGGPASGVSSATLRASLRG